MYECGLHHLWLLRRSCRSGTQHMSCSSLHNLMGASIHHPSTSFPFRTTMKGWTHGCRLDRIHVHGTHVAHFCRFGRGRQYRHSTVARLMYWVPREWTSWHLCYAMHIRYSSQITLGRLRVTACSSSYPPLLPCDQYMLYRNPSDDLDKVAGSRS